MTIRELSNGASVHIVDDADVGPEAVAMLQALYSRSADSVEKHLKEVRAKGSAKFMQSFYVGYNHKSIADCGLTTLFFEGVSLLAAKAIQDWPLYSGQETSTRYLNMADRPIIDPVDTGASNRHLQHWMDFYRRAVAAVPDEVRRRYPRRESDPENKYEAAVKARTFDVCRGFLPAGITTQLSWHSNLRQLHDHLATLRRHPLTEVRDLAKAAMEVLAETYPSSGFDGTAGAGVSGVTDGQVARDEWLEKVAADYTYDVFGQTNCLETNSHGRLHLESNYHHLTLDRYAEILKTRPRGAVLPHFITNAGQFRLQFDLDFGSFRDLQRHRNGVCRMPILDGQHGFERWYLDELPDSLREEAASLVNAQRREMDGGSIANDLALVQYYRPLGDRVHCDVTYGLPALLYVLELRSQKTVHPTLRRRILEAADRLRDAVPPYVTMHIDRDPDDWNLRRGQQDIRRVEA